ncbi:hypothetical protein BLNAU_10544 [Blattamonas nauphoetae]|uniref:Uncharacterized protein n=1 Tax=Blattamonas nauphoetae TaxID=2049346 RepID=A0ABQ9XRX1_9EUKA|nr:hypothetical protein BLNAU_10544 [Blattamonas nauphoetae]
MGSNISRHIQADSLNSPPKLGDDSSTILRKIRVIIDSCVGVLKQTEFLDFDDPLTNEQLSDLSHLLYLSFPTQPRAANNQSSLNQYLFRLSTFSLFGHVVVNSQTFEDYRQNVDSEGKNPILHVITGTPGMGKSAISHNQTHPETTVCCIKNQKNGTQQTLTQIEQQDEVLFDNPMEIDAGSVIKKNSVLAAGSSLACTLTVKNLLKGQNWHVVDDLMFSKSSNLQVDQNYVLFTSPQGSRWKEVNNDLKGNGVSVVEYVVPKYTPQEQAALLNTLGTRKGISDDDISHIKKSVELFSFIPRFVLKPRLAQQAVDSVWKADKHFDRINPEDLFKDEISHKMIHFSCPQYDCHNWHTEFATELARKIIFHTFNIRMQQRYTETLQSLTTSPEFNQQRGQVFHNFVSDAILGGFHLISPWRLFPKKKTCSNENIPENIRLPPPIGESYVILRNSTTMSKIFLPDIKNVPHGKLSNFQQSWSILFSSPRISFHSILYQTCAFNK